MRLFRHKFIVSSICAAILLFTVVNSAQAQAIGERIPRFGNIFGCSINSPLKEDFGGETRQYENGTYYISLDLFFRSYVNDQYITQRPGQLPFNTFGLRRYYNEFLVFYYNALINSNAAGRTLAELNFNTSSEDFATYLDITERMLGNIRKYIQNTPGFNNITPEQLPEVKRLCLVNIDSMEILIGQIAAKADELKISRFGFFEQDLSLFGFPATIDAFVRQDQPLVRYIIFVVNIATAIIVAIALLLTILGGYRYMTAGGDAKNVEEAKKYIKAAILGIVLALMAFLLLSQVSTQFTQNLQEPGANAGGGANGANGGGAGVGAANANNGAGALGGGGGGDVDFGNAGNPGGDAGGFGPGGGPLK